MCKLFLEGFRMRKQANKTPKVFSSDQDKPPLEEGHYSVDDVNFPMSEDE